MSARSDATERASNTTVLCPGWDDRARPFTTIWEKKKDNLEVPDEIPNPISDFQIERRLSCPKRVNRSLGRGDMATDSLNKSDGDRVVHVWTRQEGLHGDTSSTQS